jgi:hypothetical protein
MVGEHPKHTNHGESDGESMANPFGTCCLFHISSASSLDHGFLTGGESQIWLIIFGIPPQFLGQPLRYSEAFLLIYIPSHNILFPSW